jgi:hypothetical protein
VEKTSKSEAVVMEDTNIVAYLNYKGFRFSPFRKSPGSERIAFHVYGDIDDTLAEFYDPKTAVGVQEFVSCLKKVRSSMFLLKGKDEESKL